MAATSLHVASGAVAVGDGATGLGIGVAKGATSASLGIARHAASFALGVARASVVAPAAIIGVAGPNRASEALWRANTALADTQQATTRSLLSANDRANEAMTNARNKASNSMQETRSSLQTTAQQDGLYLRVALGSDTAEVVLAAQRLISEFSKPMAAVAKIDLFRAAKAWATLQRASRAPRNDAIALEWRSREAVLPLDSERWMRYTAAAFGAYRAGKLFDDKSAEWREQQRLRQEALAKSAEERQGVLSSFSASVAEAEADHKAQRQAKREAIAAQKQEKRDARAAENAARREARMQKKASRQRGTSATLTTLLVEPDVVTQHQEILTFHSGVTELARDISVTEGLDEALDGDGFLDFSEQDQDDTSSHTTLLIDDVGDGADQSILSTPANNRKARNLSAACERSVLKAAKDEKNEVLKNIREQERKALAHAKALRRQALAEAKSHGQDALKKAMAEWETPAGRAKQALACAGLDPEGIEVLWFEEGNKPKAGEPQVPGQLIAVDHVKECVVVALRGSSCLRDALLDLDCKPEPISLGGIQGLAHGGMLRAAQKLAVPISVAVEEALSKIGTSSRRVVVAGHSLGAGVGALLTALWHDDDECLVGADVRCLAFACPQVLDLRLAEGQAKHTTSLVVGDDCVPCLSYATCIDLRGALLALAAPESQGLEHSFSSAEILVEESQASLADRYRAVREIVGSAPGRLYPAGRLIKHTMGQKPRHEEHTVVDEMVVTTDMVMGHMPRRYLASVVEIMEAGGCSEDLWSESSTSLTSGIAHALQQLPCMPKGEAVDDIPVSAL